jgi:hypothetical protein
MTAGDACRTHAATGINTRQLTYTFVCSTPACMKRNRQQISLILPGEVGDAFDEFEQLLVSNSGEDAFDVAIQLLTAKLFDERRHAEKKAREVFVLDGSPAAVHARINTLYGQAIKAWPDLDAGRGRIEISPEQLVRCLRPLIGWRILDSDLAHLDAALERLVARDAKGSLGQYFTPRDVIRMCVMALSPKPSDVVLDPACGSAAFLYEVIQHARGAGGRLPRCLGIDLGQRAVRVATLLSHAVDPNVLVIHRGNSLDGRAYATATPNEWRDFIRSPLGKSHPPQSWGAWHKLRCTLLLTNPPFAGEIDDPVVLAAYESQRAKSANKKGAVGREHLFLERAIQLLAPGGRLAIVVPQGVLANSTASYLRRWILSECRVLAVVGLHSFAFLPYTGVKTSVLFLERPLEGEKLPADYPIAFVTSRRPGKDSSGRRLGDSDYASIATALSSFFVQQQRPWATAVDGPAGESVETVNLSEVLAHDRLDSEFYAHDIRRLYLNLTGNVACTIGDSVARSIPRFSRKAADEIDYLDISSVDGRSGIAIPTRVSVDDAPSRASHLVETGDVLVSTVRPERNVVALVTKTGDAPLVASNGFCLLRANRIDPELVFAYCKTDAFRRLLARCATASMYPAATDRDVLALPFVIPPNAIAASIVSRVQEGFAMMERAREAIAAAVAEMESVVNAVALGEHTTSEHKPAEAAKSKRSNTKVTRSRKKGAVNQRSLPGLG